MYRRKQLLAPLAGLILSLTLITTAHAAPPIPITNCGVITAPGKYRLANDLSAPYTCFLILANNVDFMLDGHTITGPFATADGTRGILALNVTGVQIKGPGTITNFGRGIDFEGVHASTVKDVTSAGNFFGFVINRDFITNPSNLSEDNEFKGNIATGNHQHGFTMNGANNNIIKGNIASDNWATGILLANGTGNEFKDNTATGNSGDLADANIDCDDNIWKDNTFYTANQSCIH